MSLAAAACLALGLHAARIETDRFTLAWTHSIEKIEWQEDYTLRGNRLILRQARIKGSGAGMDPPEDAVLKGGWWRYVPKLPPLPELRLTVSPYTADYRLCWKGACRSLSAVLNLQGEGGVVVVRPCG